MASMIDETPKPDRISTDDPAYKIETRSPSGTINRDDVRRMLRSLVLVIIAGVTTWIGTTIIPYITAEKDWWDDLAVALFALVITGLNSLRVLFEGVPKK